MAIFESNYGSEFWTFRLTEENFNYDEMSEKFWKLDHFREKSVDDLEINKVY